VAREAEFSLREKRKFGFFPFFVYPCKDLSAPL